MVRVVRRCSFLLLEVMIAFFLMAICLLPLLQPHYAILQSDVMMLEESKIERIVQKLYSQFLVSLYRGEVLWSDVDHYDTPLRPRQVDATQLEGLPYDVHYILRVTPYQGKKGELSKPVKDTPRNQRINHLLEVKYTFTPKVASPRQEKEFTFRVYAKRNPPASQL